ncbi:hypothetical protein [Flindersiella endophytica]
MLLVRRDPPTRVRFLPADVGSLDGPLPHNAPPRTLFTLGTYGGMSVEPDADFELLFGRNYEEVHVCVGGDDQQVSRQQGCIRYERSRWILRNTGQRPIRFPRQQIVYSGHSQEIPPGYTPLFVIGARREHLLQVRVSGTRPPSSLDSSIYEATTFQPVKVKLEPGQLLVLACLGQHYLRHEPDAQPVPWSLVECELQALRPAERWTWKKAAWIVKRLRDELSEKEGMPRVRASEIPGPVGNTLNHNLITGLMATARLLPKHLRLLKKEAEAYGAVSVQVTGNSCTP